MIGRTRSTAKCRTSTLHTTRLAFPGALVHPQAREAESSSPDDLLRAIQVNHLTREDARRSVEDMTRFFELMTQYDPEVGEFLIQLESED